MRGSERYLLPASAVRVPNGPRDRPGLVRPPLITHNDFPVLSTRPAPWFYYSMNRAIGGTGRAMQGVSGGGRGCCPRVPTGRGRRGAPWRVARRASRRVSRLYLGYISQDGMPFRGRYWLRTLGAHPKVGLSVGTLGIKSPNGPRFNAPPELLRMTASVRAGFTRDITRDIRHVATRFPHSHRRRCRHVAT